MVNFDCNCDFNERSGLTDFLSEHLEPEKDLVMERILESIHHTPMGKVLKRIAALPEVRKEKVLNVRRQLNEGEYDLTARLDIALEKVLEDLD